MSLDLDGRAGENHPLRRAGSRKDDQLGGHTQAEMASLAHGVLQEFQAQGIGRKCLCGLKRLMDIGVSAVVLLLIFPTILVLALLIKLDSPGPVFFVQARWGRGKRPIRIYKLRSMYADRCDVSGVNQTRPDDPRVTRIGRFMRQRNLDELPQFFNVLRGDLSLVGPRCHAIGMCAAGQTYEKLVPQYHVRHVVRPGMTGLAQIRGFRGPVEHEGAARQRIVHDLHYAAHFNLLGDVRILAATLVREAGGGTGM